MKTRAVIRIYGEVQGVGFRAWIARRALKLGLKGYVENVIDGSVLVVAEGDRSLLEKFIEECRRGPPLARVNDVEVKWEDYRGEFEDFEVKWSELELPR